MLSRFILFITGILFACVISEVVLRIYNPLPFSVSFGSVELPSNRTYRYRFEDQEVVLQLNSLGFRGPELPQENEGIRKIVTVGGSTTECRALTEGKTWPDLLAQKLEEKSDPIWLNNAGFSGHSTHGHYLLYRDHIRRLKPDMILLLVGANDMGRGDLLSPDANFGPELGHVLKKSHLLHTLYNIYRLYRVVPLNPQQSKFQLDQLATVEDFSKTEEEAIYRTHRERYIPAYRKRLKDLVQMMQRDGVEVVLITQPLLYGDKEDPTTGIDLGRLFLEGKNYDATNFWSFPGPIPSRTYWQTLEIYNDVTRSIAEEHGLPLIDLAKLLPKDSQLFYDSMHFTEIGAKRVADEVFGLFPDFTEK